ncbi:helix-turn-helix domain-containing protein [Microbacterium invictum]|uniref:Helix-turn-helix domain-containing protein n=1 Tax=Microbacterium invictum TaxID=515415 RepID=A0ABZ0VA33_9MICO|nr:helix-turn-helix domain-containing protein [Microbacterium invictum]WQB70483.1 helix-turn-helix domain-containing protein [Microbacterium invictum]
MDKRTYGQFCGLTRGADLLGGRWTLPIVRDLLLGPARFGELQAAFPGISTAQLTARLKELEAEGIVQREVGEMRGVRYALTSWGRQLEPVITALGRWGAMRMDVPREGEIVTAAGMATMLRTGFAGRAADGPALPTTFEIFADGLVAHGTVMGDLIDVAVGPADAPDLRLSAGDHFRAFVAGELTADEYAALPGVTVEGDASLLPMFADLFRVPFEPAA